MHEKAGFAVLHNIRERAGWKGDHGRAACQRFHGHERTGLRGQAWHEQATRPRQQALFAQNFVCLASAEHPRIRAKLSRRAFSAEGHIVVSAAGTGHSIVDKVLAKYKVERRTVLRVASFLGVARIVAQTELLVIVPRLLGNTLASQERVQLLEPPVPLPAYKVKQHWHERFNADAANIWLRRTMADLFSGHGLDA